MIRKCKKCGCLFLKCRNQFEIKKTYTICPRCKEMQHYGFMTCIVNCIYDKIEDALRKYNRHKECRNAKYKMYE